MLVSISTNPPKTREKMLEYVESLNDLDIDYIHCDVMDGEFVPQTTYDYVFLPRIKKVAVLDE